MGKGNYGALKQLTPIQADFGKIARDQEQVELQNKEIQRRIDREKKEDERYKDAQKKAGYKDLEEALGKNELVTTGDPVIDEKFAKLYIDTAEAITKNWEQKQLNPDNAKLYLEASNLYNIPKQTREAMDTITTYVGALKKGLADGTLSESQNANALDKLHSFIRDNNLQIKTDDKGQVVYLTGGGKKITHEQFLQGAILPELVFKFNETEFKKEVGDLGTHMKDVQSGYVTTGGKQLTKSASDYLAGKVEEVVGTKEKPSRTAMSYWVDDLKQDPKKFDWQKVHDYVQSIGMSSVDTSYSKKIDLGSMRADQENAGKDNKTTKPIDGIQPMRYSDGSLIKFPSARTGKSNKDGLGFTTEKPVNVGIGGSQVIVNSFYIGGDGLITYEGQKEVTDPDPTIGKHWIKVTNNPIKGEDANIFARALLFKDASELIKEAELKANGTSTTLNATELLNKYRPK